MGSKLQEYLDQEKIILDSKKLKEFNSKINFQKALLWMKKGNKTRYNNKEYFIDNGDLCNIYLGKPMVTTLTLKMFESNEWELI